MGYVRALLVVFDGSVDDLCGLSKGWYLRALCVAVVGYLWVVCAESYHQFVSVILG